MKKVYLCGSLRFRSDIEELLRRLRKEGIEAQASLKLDKRGIVACLEGVDEADVVYVVNPNGYIGKSVSVDIGYAYARGRPIYTNHPIADPPVMPLIDRVLSSEQLIDLLTHS